MHPTLPEHRTIWLALPAFGLPKSHPEQSRSSRLQCLIIKLFDRRSTSEHFKDRTKNARIQMIGTRMYMVHSMLQESENTLKTTFFHKCSAHVTPPFVPPKWLGSLQRNAWADRFASVLLSTDELFVQGHTEQVPHITQRFVALVANPPKLIISRSWLMHFLAFND